MGLALTATTVLPPQVADPDDEHGAYCSDPWQDCWCSRRVASISYSTFQALRQDVADYYGVRPYARVLGRRAVLPTGGRPFWLHSDCEGTWTPGECRAVAALLWPYVVEREGHLPTLAAHLVLCLEWLADEGQGVRFE